MSGQSRTKSGERTKSYGQDGTPSPVDHLGVWLSRRSIVRAVGDFSGKRVADFGCGFEARFARSIRDTVDELILVDLRIARDLHEARGTRVIEGRLPGVLSQIGDGTLDVVLCISVLEHLNAPEEMLAECRRVLAPGGICVVNVPTWRGKWFLELSAFRLGLSPRDEMDDHKDYYDPRDLWPLLVRAGFLPHQVRCKRHKLGLNTLAVCRLDAGPPDL